MNCFNFGKKLAQNINDLHISKLIPILKETKQSFQDGYNLVVERGVDMDGDPYLVREVAESEVAETLAWYKKESK